MTRGSLSDEDRRAFKISAEAEEALRSLARRSLATVLGADGRGGSGVFVRVPDGRLGLLTARHVVVAALVTGELQVGSLAGAMGRSIVPSAIRCARRADVALILMPDDFQHEALSVDEWTAGAVPATGTIVVCSGVVGRWKDPDVVARHIPKTPIIHYWTTTLPAFGSAEFSCDVDPADARLPDTFAGMSGGPVFDVSGHFVGMTVTEKSSGSSITRLNVLLASTLADVLVNVDPSGAPTDLIIQKGGVQTSREYRSRNYRVGVRLEVNADFFWSLSNPEHRFGRFGIVRSVRFIDTATSGAYPVNVESLFYFDGDGLEQRIAALNQEADFLLERWSLYAPTPTKQPPEMSDPSAQRPTEEEIRVAAYYRWMARGRGDGDDLEDWLEAEHALTSRNSAHGAAESAATRVRQRETGRR